MQSQMAEFPFLKIQYTHVYIYVYDTYHFFVHSSVDKHLICFHIMTIVYNAVVDVGIQISFRLLDFIFLDIYPEVRVSDHSSVFNFSEEPLCCFP